MAANTDYFQFVGLPGTATTLEAPGHTIGGTTFNVVSTNNWPTLTAVSFAVDKVQTINGVVTQVPGSYTEWIGVVTSATTIATSVISPYSPNSDQNYAAGATTRVYIPVSATRENKLVEGLRMILNDNATLKTAPVLAALGAGSGALNGWNILGYNFSSITYNGNGSYTGVVTGQDVTNALYPGTRIRGSRATTAPTQSTSLNGTNQYYTKTTPNGMVWVDDFASGAWVKLTSYPTGSPAGVISRYNGTSGWVLRIDTTGQVMLIGVNGGSGNFSYVQSYQSLPLNRWVFINAQLDMSAFSVSATTSYVMFDGVDVPSLVSRAGTNPTALVQAGDLQVGTANAGSGYSFLPGKVSQAFVTSAKITQTQARAIYSQGITNADTTTYNMASAYSFNNSIADLNTTSANNLSAVNGAVATNNDVPFALGTDRASGFTAGVEEFGIVMSSTFSTNTTVVFQAPNGSAWPTSGALTAIYYSGNKVPYGLDSNANKWALVAHYRQSQLTIPIGGINQWFPSNAKLTITVGAWIPGWDGSVFQISSAAGVRNGEVTMASPTTFPAVNGVYSQPLGEIIYSGASVTAHAISGHRKTKDPINLPGQEVFTLTAQIALATGTETWEVRGDRGLVVLYSENAYV